MSNITFITRNAETSRQIAEALLRKRVVVIGKTPGGAFCWRFHVGVVEHLSRGQVGRHNAAEMGFDALPDAPDWLNIVCDSGPADVVMRLHNRAITACQGHRRAK